MTKAPVTSIYFRVVSRETVRMALMIAALYDLRVKSADICNACVQAYVTEKVWTVLGLEFSGNVIKKL